MKLSRFYNDRSLQSNGSEILHNEISDGLFISFSDLDSDGQVHWIST